MVSAFSNDYIFKCIRSCNENVQGLSFTGNATSVASNDFFFFAKCWHAIQVYLYKCVSILPLCFAESDLRSFSHNAIWNSAHKIPWYC